MIYMFRVRNYCLQMYLQIHFKSTEIYELESTYFLSAPELAWKAALRITGVELGLLTDIDMLLMVEEGIRGGICHAIHTYAKDK